MTEIQVLGSEDISRIVTRIAHQVLERNGGAANIALVGIRSRGEFLAQRIAAQILDIESIKVPVGALDIGLYRDDYATNPQLKIHKTEIPFDVNDKTIILVDDVFYTGRSIRAALDAIMDFGRPNAIQLAVLIDRGHRELPIRADFVGKNLPTSSKESVNVLLNETDGSDSVTISKLGDGHESCQ
jgi:pyrimidine operon attenuation protein/uracil phosphoribosyltransferase